MFILKELDKQDFAFIPWKYLIFQSTFLGRQKLLFVYCFSYVFRSTHENIEYYKTPN